MKILGRIQENQDITSKEYLDLYGGKIDVIKVDGVAQDIENKIVNIDLSGKADANQLPLKVDNLSSVQLKDSDITVDGKIENVAGKPTISSSYSDGNGFELCITPEGLVQVEHKIVQDEDGNNIQSTKSSMLITEDSLSNTNDELKTYIDAIEIKSITPEDEAYAATYALFTSDDKQLGNTINIPKDFLVKDAVLRVCEEADVPEMGFKVGDKYIDFIINVAGLSLGTSKHIYLNVQDLVDVYTAEGIISINNNKISAKVTTGNGLSILNDSLAMNLASESTNGALSKDNYLKLSSIESNAQVNKIESVNTADFIIEDKVLKVASGKLLLTEDQFNTLNSIIDAVVKVEESNINGAIKINGVDTTIYTHPTVTPVEASAYKVGKDGTGHVVLGTALALSDLTDDEQHRVVTDVEKAA